MYLTWLDPSLDIPSWAAWLWSVILFGWLGACAYYDLFRKQLVPHTLSVSPFIPAIIITPFIANNFITHLIVTVCILVVLWLMRLGFADLKIYGILSIIHGLIALPILFASFALTILYLPYILFLFIMKKPIKGEGVAHVPMIYLGTAGVYAYAFSWSPVHIISFCIFTLLLLITGLLERKLFPLPEISEWEQYNLDGFVIDRYGLKDTSGKYVQTWKSDRYRVVLDQLISDDQLSDWWKEKKLEFEAPIGSRVYKMHGHDAGKKMYVNIDSSK